MKTYLPNDSELDNLANAYASKHGVSYVEALSAVAQEAHSAQLPAFAETNTAQPTDAQLDVAAKRYTAAHGVNYAEALTAVADDMRSGTRPPAFAQASMAPLSDVQLDMAAKKYASTHSVNYCEALTLVREASIGFSELVRFSEAVSPSPITQMLEQQTIEIFRAGNHLDDQGVAHHFSEADLNGMASSYNPALREAPLTVGHPKDNLPAYGWVKSVARSASGALAITPHQLEPQFAEMVQAGRFKKRSASFYPPQAPNNPTPGKWYLRHVAFLGAQPPAVAGLKDIQF